MKELKPSGLFYVPVPMQYKKAEIINILMDAEGDNPYKLSEVWLTIDNYKQNVFSQKGQYYEIIGSVTAEHIDFDPEPYVRKIDNDDVYFNYKSGFFGNGFTTADASFRSLLTANDVHFVNPYELKGTGHYENVEEYFSQQEKWLEAESKLVEKILILKPL